MATKFAGIKTVAEYRRGELARDILRLIGAGVAVGATIVAPNTVQLIDYLDPKGRNERNRIWKTIKYLEEKDRVTFQERDGHTYVQLTATGRQQLDEDAIWELAIARPRRWDHKWRIVMFDLPSKRETARQAFRHKLEDLGFKFYQRSVFIFPYECAQEVNTVAQWYGVEQYVRYIVATEINDMRRFAQLFDLL